MDVAIWCGVFIVGMGLVSGCQGAAHQRGTHQEGRPESGALTAAAVTPDDDAGPSKVGAIALPAKMEGHWCINTDAILLTVHQERPAMEMWLKAVKAMRGLEHLRILIDAGGGIVLRMEDGTAVAEGTVVAAEVGGGVVLTFAWQGTPPPVPPFHEEKVQWLNGQDWWGVAGSQVYFAMQEASTCWEHRATPKPEVSPALRAPWIDRPVAEWPQVVLTNSATFEGDRELTGASAYLVRNGQSLEASTARHLLGPAGGIDPPLAPSRLDEALISWQLTARTKRHPAVDVVGLAQPIPDDDDGDWLFLRVAHKATSQLPAEPLRVRRTPVAFGERVWLIGCPYAEADCLQNVYPGIVSGRQQNGFRVALERPVELRGFSGAPIVDADGAAVGTLVTATSAAFAGAPDVEGGAIDLTPLLQ